MSNAVQKTQKKQIYPVIALLSGILIIVFGLLTAKRLSGVYYLLGVFLWLCLFGMGKNCLRVLPGILILGGIFFGISYAIAQNTQKAMGLAVRIAAVMLSVVPGMGVEPVRMTRNLSQLHTPRSVTLGMLIARSFMPMLTDEEKRIKEAMKTRGAGNAFNPKIFYRAFLVPLVMRLVNISDTLSLSVETRGFTLGKTPYTIYKKETIGVKDILFFVGILCGSIVAVVL